MWSAAKHTNKTPLGKVKWYFCLFTSTGKINYLSCRRESFGHNNRKQWWNDAWRGQALLQPLPPPHPNTPSHNQKKARIVNETHEMFCTVLKSNLLVKFNQTIDINFLNRFWTIKLKKNILPSQKTLVSITWFLDVNLRELLIRVYEQPLLLLSENIWPRNTPQRY